jgi:CelD/BcsL family acetyltransferase involved in cellulose biosynthesis
MISKPQFRIRRLGSLQELWPLRAPWNALAGDVPFRSFEWLESWWRAYGAGADRELCALAILDGEDQLLGLAPWYAERIGAQRSVLRFLGSGEVCSDYLTILCREQCEELVVTALVDWLCAPLDKQADSRCDHETLELCGVDERDAVVARLLDMLAARGKLVLRRRRSSCWRICLPTDWEAYLAMLSKSHRKQIRRLQRQYFDTGRARLHLAQDESQLEHGLALLARLHQRRRESLGDRGCFASPRFAAFHAETARRLLAKGALRLFWLEVDGVNVAAEYQVIGGKVVYAYQSGIEPSALGHEPGRLITVATLRRAVAEGRQALDFLRGDEAYKAHWRAKPRATLDAWVTPDTPAARLRHNVWLASANVKNWLKSNLGMIPSNAP